MSTFNPYNDERLLIDAPRTAAAVHGCLLFPNSYSIGMSSLATHTLYTLLNSLPDIACERVFAEEINAAQDALSVRSVESGAALGSFDFIAVTSSYELDWPVLVRALTAAKIAPLHRERTAADPLILAGGPAVTAAPLPLAEIYDIAFIGEIEPAAADLSAVLQAESREAALARAATVPGFFVPALHGRPAAGSLVRRCAKDLNEFTTASAILTPHAEFADRYLLEIGRGCGRSCRFCMARCLYRPLRWRSIDRLWAALDGVRDQVNAVGLVAAAVSDYPDIDRLCDMLSDWEKPLNVSTSSVRMETATVPFLRFLARSGQTTVTFAPEAASPRLREIIGKPIADDMLFTAVENAAAAGLKRVRLYYMVGLPGETADDRLAIAEAVAALQAAFPSLRLRINIGAFTPRPHTPFECIPMPPVPRLRRMLAETVRAVEARSRVEVVADSARWSAIQCALLRGDERIGPALAEASCAPEQSFTALQRILQKHGQNPRQLADECPVEDAPWKVVDIRCRF